MEGAAPRGGDGGGEGEGMSRASAASASRWRAGGEDAVEWRRGRGGRRARGRELPAARARWSSSARDLAVFERQFSLVREARWRTHM